MRARDCTLIPEYRKDGGPAALHDPAKASVASQNLASVTPLFTKQGVDQLRSWYVSRTDQRYPLLSQTLDEVMQRTSLHDLALRDLANSTARIVATGNADEVRTARHLFSLATGVPDTAIDALLGPVVGAWRTLAS